MFYYRICAYYSWKLALNVGLDVSIDNMKNRKGMPEIGREADSTKAYTTNDGISR
jgi:hypothetical protein